MKTMKTMNPIKTEFKLNDIKVNGKRIVVTKKVTLFDTDVKVRYVIRATKGKNGLKMVYTDPMKVLAKFSELIKV